MCDNHNSQDQKLFVSIFCSQKKLRFSQNRPKTAPNAKLSFSKDNNFLTSSNLAPSLRPKKSNQVSPLIGETFSYINYDGACERQIRQGLKGGLINGIITISEMTGKWVDFLRALRGIYWLKRFFVVFLWSVVLWLNTLWNSQTHYFEGIACWHWEALFWIENIWIYIFDCVVWNCAIIQVAGMSMNLVFGLIYMPQTQNSEKL